MPTRVQESAEAICGALHALHWEFKGETDHGASTWFTRGEVGKQVRVEVQRSSLADVVIVNVEWLNMSKPPTVVRGRQTLQVTVTSDKGEVMRATERAVEKCLLIFRDVLSSSGVAGLSGLQTTHASIDISGEDDGS